MPDDDAIAALGIREVRALIAQLEGDEDGEENAAPEPPKPAEAEPADLRGARQSMGQGVRSIPGAIHATAWAIVNI